MLAYDAMSFGTPLHLLNLPDQAIKTVTQKVEDATCTLTHYTQDCKTLADLKGTISSIDAACFGESSLDVGYICKKCHIVYPARDACVTHQRMACYASGGHGGKTMLKLEQLQHECRVCNEKMSTVLEVKAHCQEEAHKAKVGQLGCSILPSSSSSSSHSAPAHSSPKPSILPSVHTSSNAQSYSSGSTTYLSDHAPPTATSTTSSAYSPGKSPVGGLPAEGDKSEEAKRPLLE